ncbi:MAG: HTTM domain-containing protein [Bacteroidota bacterium]
MKHSRYIDTSMMPPINIGKIFDKKYLFSPMDNSAIVLFRVFFGLLITAEAWGAIMTGWVKRAFIDPEYTFNFIGFEFLQPLPGNGMYYYFILMGLAGVLVMIGWYYRVAVTVYFVMWSCVYLMQKTHYNNHYYLLMLLLGIMIFVPANQFFSLDAKRKQEIKSLVCGRWVQAVFVVQLFIVYTYAAFSKIYEDWLLARPIAIWFRGKQEYWLIGDLLQEEWLHTFVVYGGIFFDMLVIPALLWRRTRMLAIAVSVFFHLFNSAVFQIGIFPYLALSFLVFFFDPEEIRRTFFKSKPTPSKAELESTFIPTYAKLALAIGYGYFIIQTLLPVRYHLYPGNVHWTEEGHRLAWKMMLRAKSASIYFNVINKDTGEVRMVRPSKELPRKQARKVASTPDVTWQYVQRLKDRLAGEGWTSVEIYAISKCSLNGRPSQPLIKPDYDLAKAEWHTFLPSDWINPLDETL